MTKNKKLLPRKVNEVDNPGKRCIILVDDDELDRQLFISALEELRPNAKIRQFCNGVDLMSYLLDAPIEELPHLIFLDINMPIMNGEECLSNIRSESDLNKIPVILYSNYYDNFKMEALKKKGAEHYFQKPKTFVALKRYIGVSINSIEKKRVEEFIIE